MTHQSFKPWTIYQLLLLTIFIDFISATNPLNPYNKYHIKMLIFFGGFYRVYIDFNSLPKNASTVVDLINNGIIADIKRKKKKRQNS